MAAVKVAFFEHVDVEKPNTDHRQYRFSTLPNNLQVLVVSDAKCDDAAAALSVRVGSVFDPPEVQGLAHFCEHMLFLGTEKYPKEGEYSEFLAKHGGYSNAYTAETVTNYFFSVKPEELEGALDRFAQFFIAPLFTASATKRELNAVDSEHSKNLQNDAWRQSQLLREAIALEHPLHHFMTGNSETLRDLPAQAGLDVRAALLDFHAKYYSANVMRLVIVGREEPQELLALATTYFASIIDRCIDVPRNENIGGNSRVAFPEFSRSRVVHVVPINDVRAASFQFVLPGQKERWRSKPTRYLAHLIGHEGKGSLLAALKQRELATELSAGDALDEAGVCVFTVSVYLTSAGEADIDTIGDFVFAYIGLMRRHGPDEHLWHELQSVSEIGFRFRSLCDPMDTASGAAHALQDYPPEHVLSGNARLWEYEPSHISELLAELTASNLRLLLESNSNLERCDRRERWYGTQYSDNAIDVELCRRWEEAATRGFADLVLPRPNPFLPDDLEVKPAGHLSPTPELLLLGFALGTGIAADRVASAYFRKDDEFRLPKAVCAFQVYCPFVAESVDHRELAELWSAALCEDLNEFAYDAQVAGVSYSMQATSWGLALSFEGYTAKLPALLAAVTQRMSSLTDVSSHTFGIVKATLERDMSNAAALSPPYVQAFGFEACLSQRPAHSMNQRLAALRQIGSCDMLHGVGRSLLSHCHVECLIQGNFSVDEGRQLVRTFLSPLGISRPLAELPQRAVAYLPPGVTVLERAGTNPEERNGAVVALLQLAEASLSSTCLTAIVAQIVSQRFFDELRTKQQLGYIVSASPQLDLNGFVSLRLVVQSECPPQEVATSIQHWCEEEWRFLESELGMAEFLQYRTSLVAILREQPKSLSEEFGNNWSELSSRGFYFTRREARAECTEALSLVDLKSFVAERLMRAPALYVLVSGSAHETQRTVLSLKADRYWSPDDVSAFRNEAAWRVWNSNLQSGQIPVLHAKL